MLFILITFFLYQYDIYYLKSVANICSYNLFIKIIFKLFIIFFLKNSDFDITLHYFLQISLKRILFFFCHFMYY